MNELQQVLLIFAVVVIAGLFFLSRSRQIESKKDSKNSTPSASSHPEHSPIVSSNKQNSGSVHDEASDALNNLGTPHIPVSETTEQRVTHNDIQQGTNQQSPNHSSNANNPSQALTEEERFNQNQGVLSFGEGFDLDEPKKEIETAPTQATPVDESFASTEHSSDNPIHPDDDADNLSSSSGKHHVLVVDDPGMTGEIDENSASSDYIKPSFGIPEEEAVNKPVSATNKAPEVYVLMVMSTSPGQEFEMTDVNQALLGVGLTYSEQAIFVKKDNMGNDFIKVANMLEPGTFPVERLSEYATPGVALILELPTTVRAPAAMHDMIMMARKVSQRLKGRLYNVERQLIKESDLQSMRDAALDYESEPL